MRILVLGSGAKDHAITWWLNRSCLISGLFVARGNFCTPDIATKLPDVDPSDKEAVYQACLENKIDMVFIGTEAPLLSGVIEYLNEKGIETFGAPSKSIKLEDDKAFSRSFAERHGVPIPRRSVFADYQMLEKYLRKHEGEDFIIKSNNISPSRETLHTTDTNAMLSYARKLLEKGPVLLEEFIYGHAVTVTTLLDNNGYLVLPFCAEYTWKNTTDTTPTGGMGAICPVPLTDSMREAIRERIVKPTLYGMKVEQLSYKGVLTFSIILKDYTDPVLVDYHVRFNDPATQAFVPIIKNDLVDIYMKMKDNKVSTVKLETTEDCSVAVVLASEGYPMDTRTGRVIKGLSALKRTMIEGLPIVFAGAIDNDEEGRPVTTGGRNITVVGLGKSIEEANKKAYRTISSIEIEGGWYREDIGTRYFQQ